MNRFAWVVVDHEMTRAIQSLDKGLLCPTDAGRNIIHGEAIQPATQADAISLVIEPGTSPIIRIVSQMGVIGRGRLAGRGVNVGKRRRQRLPC